MSNVFCPPSNRRRLALLALIAVAGTCLSLLAYGVLHSKDENLLGTRLDIEAERRAKAIASRFRSNASSIWGLSGFVRRGQPGSPDEFQEAAERVLKSNTDIRAVYWIPHLTPDKRSVYEQAAAGLGLTGFQFRELSAEYQLRPATVTDDRELLPIYFAAPPDRQQALLGLDILSQPTLRKTIAEAIGSGRTTMSTAVAWPDDPQGSKVILNLRAVYSEAIAGDDPQAPEVRRNKLLGLLAVSICIDTLLAESLSDFGPGIDVQFCDTTASPQDQLLCVYRSQTKDVAFSAPGGTGSAACPARGAAAHYPGCAGTTLGDLLPTHGRLFGQAIGFVAAGLPGLRPGLNRRLDNVCQHAVEPHGKGSAAGDPPHQRIGLRTVPAGNAVGILAGLYLLQGPR
jgi:hypothetical protein